MDYLEMKLRDRLVLAPAHRPAKDEEDIFYQSFGPADRPGRLWPRWLAFRRSLGDTRAVLRALWPLRRAPG